MDDIIKEAAYCFNINIYSYQKSRAVFLLNTDKGAMAIKRQADVHIAEELYRITEQLQSLGFKNAERYLAACGKPYISLKDGVYTVSTRGGGQRCSLADIDEALAIAKAIALLHKAGTGITTGIKKYEAVSPSYYDKRIACARRIKKWLNKQSHLTDIDVLFIKNYRVYLEKASNAAERIKNSKTGLSLCFGKIKEDNICVDNKGLITLLNFENSVLSAPVTDLSQLIRRFVKRGGGCEQIPRIINAYSEERALSAEEIEFLKAFSSFPHKFFSLTEKYYNSKKVFGGAHTLTRLKADALHHAKICDILNTI